MNVNSKKLQESYNELLEYTLVLLKVRTLSGQEKWFHIF